MSSSGRDGPVRIYAGLAALAGRYSGFLLDLWGTVHNGLEPLPGAVECMRELQQRSKRILLLSNAPRRSRPVIERMTEIRIPRDCYDDVLTSGEAANAALRERRDPWHARLGHRCFLLGSRDDDSVLEGVPIERVRDLTAADFIVAVGSYRRRDTVADYESFLDQAAAFRLPMICANPDLEVLRGTTRELCAGGIAARYEEKGGEVFYHGKPHAPIYDASLARLGIADKRQVLAVGDALRTDVAGALAYGIDAVLITGGLHAEALGIVEGADPEPTKLAMLYAAAGYVPTAAIPALRW